ncbi:co-chaperone YbbN [Rhodoferax sp. U11-2br]|uniref:thioredoxin family protein n=1 Tax=Rhodoferax sp. U11-2br TaxID=2838878 RepID=UPI001BE731DA|nr:thioredoxin family protein [Rhodoferax sp. U11-2br]MBT3068307.1 hypothetical protein [Rhodoferax sp. U11-2br]
MHGKQATADAIRTVDGDAFDSVVLEAPGPVTVEFMSYSCAHCRAVESPLQQVALRVAPEQQICRVNVAEEPTLAQEYEVDVTPTLVTFMRGAEVGRVVGPEPDVASLLQAVTQPFQV